MASLTTLKRKAERLESAVSAKIVHDRDYGTIIELRTSEPFPDSLDELCREEGATCEPDGKNPFGEYEYVIK